MHYKTKERLLAIPIILVLLLPLGLVISYIHLIWIAEDFIERSLGIFFGFISLTFALHFYLKLLTNKGLLSYRKT